MSVTSIRLQSDLEDSLDQLATKLSRSKNWVINEALKFYIFAQQQEEQRWKETLVALASVQSGQVVESDKVHAWLDSWGTDNELPAPKP
jgi:predicted transcriptional regulator